LFSAGYLGLREIVRTFQAVAKDFQADCWQAAFVSSHANRETAEPMAKQTTITIETTSLLILEGRNPSRAWCRQCAAEVEMIALEKTGVISNLEQAAIEEWLNSGELHRSQTADGAQLICLNSLLVRVQNTKTS
jgi:hypothetical protein